MSNVLPISTISFSGVGNGDDVSGTAASAGGGEATVASPYADGLIGDGSGALYCATLATSATGYYLSDTYRPGWDQQGTLTFTVKSNTGNTPIVILYYDPSTHNHIRCRFNSATPTLSIQSYISSSATTLNTSSTFSALTVGDTYTLTGKYADGDFTCTLYNVTTSTQVSTVSYSWSGTTLTALINGYFGFGELGSNNDTSSTGFHFTGFQGVSGPRAALYSTGPAQLTTQLDNGTTYNWTGLPSICVTPTLLLTSVCACDRCSRKLCQLSDRALGHRVLDPIALKLEHGTHAGNA